MRRWTEQLVRESVPQDHNVKQCPDCGEGTLVYDTRVTEVAPMLWRRRKCKVCGFRFSTIEIFEEDYEDLKQIEEIYESSL